MKIIKSLPRGYCHGVINAINIVSQTIKNNEKNLPIYILGGIVHNDFVKSAFESAGVITLTGNNREEMLDEINDENSIIIITAHGTSERVINKAYSKSFLVVDATCKDVKKTHDIIKEKIKADYTILFIGKENHPETEGILGIDNNIILIQNIDDIHKLNFTKEKIFITNQTTLSKFETEKIINLAKKKYPNLEAENEICLATSDRQEVALLDAKRSDISIIVGDSKSNNTNKLRDICSQNNTHISYRVDNVESIDINWFFDDNINTVHVTSGASTPSQVTKEVCSFIENFDKNNKDTWDNKSKLSLNKLIPRKTT